PNDLKPIVDAVVDMVFVRLKKGAGHKSPLQRTPHPQDRTALVEALADLLLADLSRQPREAKLDAASKPRSAAKRRAPKRRSASNVKPARAVRKRR
ncbi:MAG TPA: hypothetical protein VJT73_20765, partial [Polyangiaceae bacterium]|nr:hypothetical protein [Polyangiaceae bacterium]